MTGEFDQPSGLRSHWSAEKMEQCKREATSKERVVEGNGSAFYGRDGRKKGQPLRDTRRAATSLHSMERSQRHRAKTRERTGECNWQRGRRLESKLAARGGKSDLRMEQYREGHGSVLGGRDGREKGRPLGERRPERRQKRAE